MAKRGRAQLAYLHRGTQGGSVHESRPALAGRAIYSGRQGRIPEKLATKGCANLLWKQDTRRGHGMGFFSDRFGGRRQRDIEALLNPISGMKLQEFVIADDDPAHLKHYFRYTNREGKDEEFIAVYQRHGAERVYARTHWKRVEIDPEFRTLSERGPWSSAISHLIRTGETLAARTTPTRGHPASRVPANLTPPSLPPQPVSKATQTPSGTISGGSVQANNWQARRMTDVGDKLQRFEIGRSYQFGGLCGSDSHATLRIVVTLEGEIVPQGLALGRKLRFYLWPFRLPHDADFTLRLVTRVGAIGGSFSVLASPVEGDNETALIARFGGRDDVAQCLNAFMSSQPLRFNLSDDHESLVGFELPNDPSFKKLYDETCEALASPAGDDAPSPPPDMSLVRNNPKEYALWLVEPESGEFRVLLVKLNRAGDNMEEGWYLGETFATREEQGSFGLAAARDLRIKLSDVVKT